KQPAKKKAMWPFGDGESKESSDAEAENKKEEEKETKKTVTRQGPFGIFRKKPVEEKPKKEDDDSKAKDSLDKKEEKKSKSKSSDESESKKNKNGSPTEKEDDTKEQKEKKEMEDKKKEEASEEDKEKKEEEKEKTSDETDEKKDEYVQRAMERQRQQQLASSRPSLILYGQNPMSPQQQQQRGVPGRQQAPGQSELVMISAFSSVLIMASRYFLVNWILSKFQFDRDLKHPRQHFMWECLNDKFVKDDDIWNSVKIRPPLSMPFSNRKWNKIIKGMGPGKEAKKKKDVPLTPSRTVVVIDLDTRGKADALFAHFAEMVTFLVGANGRNKLFFGSEPEVILNIKSGGGEVTTFALAAAHVARLRAAGWKVTACVDRIAASGGYMIASQANLILAAPFAMVGSIGVMSEGLNFFEALKSVGVKPITLKAGDMKNPITTFGQVTDKDLKMTQKDLEDAHLDFIQLCRSRRPDLLEEVCNGRVLSGEKALETGMVDRILTSDEYVHEKICDGDLVMKIHLVSRDAEQLRFARFLQMLPHFGQKLQSALGLLPGGRFSSFNDFRKAQLHADSDFVGKLIKGIAFASMVRGAVQRSGLGKKKWHE
ncbi:MAG: hypothetical protein SGILL_009372, partial [Bacillariaceae sp.]